MKSISDTSVLDIAGYIQPYRPLAVGRHVLPRQIEVMLNIILPGVGEHDGVLGDGFNYVDDVDLLDPELSETFVSSDCMSDKSLTRNEEDRDSVEPCSSSTRNGISASRSRSDKDATTSISCSRIALSCISRCLLMVTRDIFHPFRSLNCIAKKDRPTT